MLVARPVAVFLCLAPFKFNWREKVFIAWTGLRGAVAIFLASIPMLVGLSKAYLYFDVAFVVVIISLLLQGWTLAPAARRLHVALPRADRGPRRVELDLPGQLEQQLVGYPVRAKSLYFRRGLIPSWSKPTLVIRDQRILSPNEADPIAAGDYIYLLAPPEKAEALDRFFVDMAPSTAPDPHLLGDFMVSGEHTLGELSRSTASPSVTSRPSRRWPIISTSISTMRQRKARNSCSIQSCWWRAASAAAGSMSSVSVYPRMTRRSCR